MVLQDDKMKEQVAVVPLSGTSVLCLPVSGCLSLLTNEHDEKMQVLSSLEGGLNEILMQVPTIKSQSNIAEGKWNWSTSSQICLEQRSEKDEMCSSVWMTFSRTGRAL